MAKKIAVFPGSFDPITIGHQSLVRRACGLFDEVIVAIGENSQKNYMYSLEDRMEMLVKAFIDCPNVSVASYSGLTIEFCKQKGAVYLLRGLRTSSDFEFERGIAQMNREMVGNIETVFMLTLPEHSHISSSIVRDIIKNGGDASRFVPLEIEL